MSIASIKVFRFDRDVSIVSKIQLCLPQPSMPGAVTINLCEAIKSADPENQAAYVGVCLPAEVDIGGRVVELWDDLPGWIDVPLGVWLESRLERQVLLSKNEACISLCKTRNEQTMCYEYSSLLAFSAASLAFDRFSSPHDSPKA